MRGSSSITRMRGRSSGSELNRLPGAAPSAPAGAAAAGIVKVIAVPLPGPSLSARMRPPCASTSPLQIASPRPWLAMAPAPPTFVLNRCGSSSGSSPAPSSATEIATCSASRTAATRMTEEAGVCRAAFASRLFSTCTTRRRSAITGGRSMARSTTRQRRSSPVRKALLAPSTRSATAEGSGETESVPESMRPMSSRSEMRPRIWSDCSTMTRKKSRISAGSSPAGSSISVTPAPLIAESGARSSWLKSPRNSERSRATSSNGARSCKVTTTDPGTGPSASLGIALISVRTLRPSGTDSTTFSARTVSALANCCASDTSRPSARRQTMTSSSSSSGRTGVRRLSTIRRASRLHDTIRPLAASKTTTPTGEVSIRVSRFRPTRRPPREPARASWPAAGRTSRRWAAEQFCTPGPGADVKRRAPAGATFGHLE